MTNNIALVGTIPVTLTVSLTSYSSVPLLLINFNLIVIDLCATTVINNKGQALSNMSFVVRFPTHSTQTFIPFTNSVATAKLNDLICGPLQYTIVEGYSFVSLIPSISGNSIDPWKISVTTTSLLDINMSYTVTL